MITFLNISTNSCYPKVMYPFNSTQKNKPETAPLKAAVPVAALKVMRPRIQFGAEPPALKPSLKKMISQFFKQTVLKQSELDQQLKGVLPAHATHVLRDKYNNLRDNPQRQEGGLASFEEREVEIVNSLIRQYGSRIKTNLHHGDDPNYILQPQTESGRRTLETFLKSKGLTGGSSDSQASSVAELDLSNVDMDKIRRKRIELVLSKANEAFPDASPKARRQSFSDLRSERAKSPTLSYLERGHRPSGAGSVPSVHSTSPPVSPHSQSEDRLHPDQAAVQHRRRSGEESFNTEGSGSLSASVQSRASLSEAQLALLRKRLPGLNEGVSSVNSSSSVHSVKADDVLAHIASRPPALTAALGEKPTSPSTDSQATNLSYAPEVQTLVRKAGQAALTKRSRRSSQ